jgi:hypothetical protein
MVMWTIRGTHGRHVRIFTVYASTEDVARYEAEVMIRSVYSRGSGTYGPLVWRCGEITMTDFESDERVVLQTQRPQLRVIDGRRL